MKRAKRTLILLGLALAGCGGTVAAPTATPQTVEVRLLATTSTYPLLEEVASAYVRPGTLLAVNGTRGNWESVYARLLAGEVPFALTTYVPVDSGLWAAPIGMDGIAIIVHRTNPIAALTPDELRLLFQGRVTTWSDLGGPDVPVQVVSREAGDDTRLALEAQVMGQQNITLGARLALSGQTMIDVVAGLPGAVGYVSMAFLDRATRGGVRAVPVRPTPGAAPVAPTRDTVSAGTYPLRAPLLIVGLAPPTGDSLYRDWFAWMQSEAGQRIIGRWYGTVSP